MKRALVVVLLVALCGLSYGIPITKGLLPDVEKKLHDTFVEWKEKVRHRLLCDSSPCQAMSFLLGAAIAPRMYAGAQHAPVPPGSCACIGTDRLCRSWGRCAAYDPLVLYLQLGCNRMWGRFRHKCGITLIRARCVHVCSPAGPERTHRRHNCHLPWRCGTRPPSFASVCCIFLKGRCVSITGEKVAEDPAPTLGNILP